MLSEKGFSLIEVLISLTILSVSVIGISQFFNQANQISAGNNSKLVATNLARMTLDRVQLNPKAYEIVLSKGMSITPFSKEKCKTKACEDMYTTNINNKTYEVSFSVNQLEEDKDLGLFTTIVKVKYGDEKETSVEGYLKNAIPTN